MREGFSWKSQSSQVRVAHLAVPLLDGVESPRQDIGKPAFWPQLCRPCWVTWSKFLPLSGPQFPPLQNEGLRLRVSKGPLISALNDSDSRLRDHPLASNQRPCQRDP